MDAVQDTYEYNTHYQDLFDGVKEIFPFYKTTEPPETLL